MRVVRPLPPCCHVSPFGGAEYLAMVVAAEGGATVDEQDALAHALVRSGCRYAVCAGHECSTWDDAVDMACVLHELREGRESPFVMTTWHEDEPLAEVVDFFFDDARIEGLAEPAPRVAVLVGGGEELAERVRETLAGTGRTR